MTTRSLLVGGLLASAFLLLACEGRETVRRFDPAFIAREADRGNLEPLKELNEACSREVLQHGKRLSACASQNEVSRLSKLPVIRF